MPSRGWIRKAVASALLILPALPAGVFAQGAGEAAEPEPSELAPGVRIERSAPNPEVEARRRRLSAWRPLYRESLTPLRREVDELFAQLEGSSLASLKSRCVAIRDRVDSVDRARLFPSSHVGLDRVLYGALERFRAAATECLAGRNLGAYRLLLEARAGVEWVDRRLEAELEPRVRLPGLPDPPGGKR